MDESLVNATMPPVCHKFIYESFLAFFSKPTTHASIKLEKPSVVTEKYNLLEEVRSLVDYDDPYEDFSNSLKIEPITFKCPLLDGKTQLKARTRLPSHRFDIWAEVSLPPGCSGGALLSGTGKGGDHLWLGFSDGAAELRWDAGGGAINLRVGVRRRRRAKLEARRYRHDALLRVDAGSVRGSATGNMTALDLDDFLFIGLPPSNVTRVVGSLGNLSGFVGCIHRLRVGSTTLIPPSHPSLLQASGRVKECSFPSLKAITCLTGSLQP